MKKYFKQIVLDTFIPLGKTVLFSTDSYQFLQPNYNIVFLKKGKIVRNTKDLLR